jgi:hypothetical protein
MKLETGRISAAFSLEDTVAKRQKFILDAPGDIVKFVK